MFWRSVVHAFGAFLFPDLRVARGMVTFRGVFVPRPVWGTGYGYVSGRFCSQTCVWHGVLWTGVSGSRFCPVDDGAFCLHSAEEGHLPFGELVDGGCEQGAHPFVVDESEQVFRDEFVMTFNEQKLFSYL